MKFKTLSFTVQRFQISPKSGKINQNFKILYFCKNLKEIFSKVIRVIYFTAPTSVPNMKALASILFEIS